MIDDDDDDDDDDEDDEDEGFCGRGGQVSGGNAYDMAGRMNFWLLEFGRERLKIGGNTEIWAGNGSLESPNSRKWSDF